ncbi:MAG TPA: hypothetical protein VGN83_25315 [Falsiroseomonas sp.]|nr:hypothetical protein [Falsiroseomonas sp.]
MRPARGWSDRSALEQAFISHIAAFERAAALRVERLGEAEIAEIDRSRRGSFALRQAAVIGGRSAAAGRGVAWGFHVRQEPNPSPLFNRLDIQITRAPAPSLLSPEAGSAQAAPRP